MAKSKPKAAKSKISHESVMVDPPLAKHWLAKLSEHQRRPSSWHVRHLVRIMRDGKWLPSNDAICFDTGGYMINGQHRLLAIIETGMTLLFDVRRGLPPESFLIMDVQKVRLVTAYMPEKCRYVLNGAAKMLIVWLKDDFPFGSMVKPTSPEIMDIVESNPKLVESAELIYSYGVRLSCLCGAGFQAFLHWYFITQENQHRDKADAFFNDIATGGGLNNGHPGLALRNRLLVSSAKLLTRDKQAYMLKALKAYLRGESLTKMSWKRQQFPTLSM